MQTRPKVKQLLNELEKVGWFRAVGQPLSIPPPAALSITRVDSWKRAQRVMRSRQTDEFLTESRNFLYREQEIGVKGTKPQKVLVNEFNNWVDATREQVKQIATGACQTETIPPEVSREYIDILDWMIGMAWIIYQYDEYIKENRLYEYIVELLKAGHCVCGWNGEFPEGSLVVF